MKGRYELLSKSDMEKIHEATLKVLMDPGILINHEGAREVFKKAGCDVDEKTKIVKIPKHIVESAIKSAPEKFTLFSRNGEFDLQMVSDGSVVNYNTFGVGSKMVDYLGPNKFQTRNSTLKDIQQIAQVTEACDNVHWFCSPVSGMELAGLNVCRATREVDSIISYSSKPVMLDAVPEYLPEYFEMQKILYGGDKNEAFNKPFLTMTMCPSSPLQLDRSLCDLVLYSPQYNFPVSMLSMAMSAASSPIFLAGTMVTHNAEVLAGITLTQRVKPGHPNYYGSSTTAFDLYTGTAPVGSPELGMISAAVAQMSQYYKIPAIVAGT
jgi:trimethylamine--corrinoid protein Co-methyltransferase